MSKLPYNKYENDSRHLTDEQLKQRYSQDFDAWVDSLIEKLPKSEKPIVEKEAEKFKRKW
jgi:hypothetical protein